MSTFLLVKLICQVNFMIIIIIAPTFWFEQTISANRLKFNVNCPIRNWLVEISSLDNMLANRFCLVTDSKQKSLIARYLWSDKAKPAKEILRVLEIKTQKMLRPYTTTKTTTGTINSITNRSIDRSIHTTCNGLFLKSIALGLKFLMKRNDNYFKMCNIKGHIG